MTRTLNKKQLREAAANRRYRESLRATVVGDIVRAAELPTSLGLTGVAVITPAIEAADGKPAKLPTVQIEAYNGGPMSVGG